MREFFERMAYRTERFMQGRNGMDDLTRAVYWLGLILLILSLFVGTGILNFLVLIILGYSVFRMLSKNIDARQRENTWYLNKTAAIRSRFGNRGGYQSGSQSGSFQKTMDQVKKNAAQQKMRFDERKEYRFFKCKCGATLRVRRGQGTKELICPVCKEHMTRNTD